MDFEVRNHNVTGGQCCPQRRKSKNTTLYICSIARGAVIASREGPGRPDVLRVILIWTGWGVTWDAGYVLFMGGGYNGEEEGMQPSLVMYDDDQESIWAIPMAEKGVT